MPASSLSFPLPSSSPRPQRLATSSYHVSVLVDVHLEGLDAGLVELVVLADLGRGAHKLHVVVQPIQEAVFFVVLCLEHKGIVGLVNPDLGLMM